MDIQNYTGIRPFTPSAKDTVGESKSAARVDALKAADELTPEMDAKLKEVCQDFEAFFLYQMMQEMHKTVNESEFMHGGRAEEIFRDMMYDEMSKEMAKVDEGPLGIAQMLYQQLKRPTIK